ncbi:MAG: peptidoglycan DD-metalloendopeptidase family protein [Alphaproteobacteria bacterium]|nr:peptidoglycan DD-metalloendopeptidase family protein [Alphaproteobacteria bacterium]
MPRNRRTDIFLPAVLWLTASLVWLPHPAAAQTNPEAEAERIEAELESERARSRELEKQAQSLARELEELRMQLVSVARDTQERENLVSNLEVQIADLRAETERRRQVLTERHSQLTGTLSALTGLSADAPRAFFLYPGEPMDAVRGSILLQSAAPVLGRRAGVLRDDLAALEAVRADLNDKLDRLSQQDAALTQDRARLESLMVKKRALYEQTAQQSRAANERLRELTEKSADLKELMAALEAERISREVEEAERFRAQQEALAAAEAAANRASEQAAPPQADGTDAAQLAALAIAPTRRPDGIRAFPAEGVITPPSVGDLIQRYGQDTGYGQTAKGIVIETRPDAAVLSPFDGKVVFAGPFRDLGPILIIEHDGGYHTVLAGFARIDVAGGHWVLAGEPIGIMPHANTVVSEFTGGKSLGSGTRPRLYMELRREGHPVNPLRWITAGSIRVNG